MVARLRTGLEWLLAAVSVTLIASLAVLVIAAVISRKLGASFTWYDEVASVMLAWITYYGAALAALKRAHLGFPNLVANAAPAFRVPLVLLAEALVVFFFAMVTWFGYQVIVVLEGDTLTSLPWVPIRFTQSVIPVGGTLFILSELLTLPERLSEAMHGAEPAEAEHLLEAARK